MTSQSHHYKTDQFLEFLLQLVFVVSESFNLGNGLRGRHVWRHLDDSNVRVLLRDGCQDGFLSAFERMVTQ